MYCIKCGVELADSEKSCPLCHTPVFHPLLTRPEGEALYPATENPPRKIRPWGLLILVTALLFLLPSIVTILIDLQLRGAITWSGYVVGALQMLYVMAVLPAWFHRPNPVIFVPCSFVSIGLYLLYISVVTDGRWFLSFAFPVLGGLGLITTTVVTLCRYIHRGQLYIFGGSAITLGLFMPVMELLLNYTFHRFRFIGWSFYPLSALVILGVILLLIALCKPVRESFGKRFFL